MGSPLKLKFLGFSLYKTGKKTGIRPRSKNIKRFKDKIRELTSRKQARSIPNILQRIKKYTMGWLGYYSIADMESTIKSLNEWISEEYGRYIGSNGRKSVRDFQTLRSLVLTRTRLGSGRTAEKDIGEFPIAIFCIGL